MGSPSVGRTKSELDAEPLASPPGVHMRKFRPVLALLAIAAVTTPARAQDAPSKPFLLGLTANHLSIDPVAAASQKVGARSWGVQFDAAYTFGKYFVVAADFAPNGLSDKAGFTETTTIGDKSSSAMLLYMSAMAGARTAPFRIIPGLAATSFGLYGGASTTRGERSISECVDCTTQNISIDGGTFVQPTIVFGEGRTRMRVSDRSYLGGKGIRNVISAGVEMGL
jgi:hypothetical protein